MSELGPLDRGNGLVGVPPALHSRLRVLEVFVDAEEVLQLAEKVWRDVRQLLGLTPHRVPDRDSQHLVVILALVLHHEQPDGSDHDVTAWKRGLADECERVERITVVGMGGRDEPVVGGISGGREQHPVEIDLARVVVHLVLVPAALRNLNNHVDDHRIESISRTDRQGACSLKLSRPIRTVAPMSEFPIDIIRSERRKRTVSAYLRAGRVKVMVPKGLEPDEEQRLVDEVAGRVIRKATSHQVDLTKRAAELAVRYDLPTPVEISWSSRQKRRWGSCSPDGGKVRISDRLSSVPGWVLDSVLIHELAHLAVPDHGPEFQALVGRFELAERAKGYLMAMGERQPD